MATARRRSTQHVTIHQAAERIIDAHPDMEPMPLAIHILSVVHGVILSGPSDPRLAEQVRTIETYRSFGV